ncbi:type II secretion system inner membrane protein GspF [Pseudenhygromyxa sp. WMMC2535]|uniref:type II secretion system inner membrane protein GspF n=1 Tax=Pseudenhygromyxa sp. WMMC2535 TaxID=2712867 RepID=UPI001553FA20|nr:type II secretion system inner membrane protein GspF [Pseudenhygromyxa sp. WMMC2535]NVB36713.1 type II secretion system inner membrane protein GspF [Pseudenhygromyxa sp. WMMC2535]
MPAYAYTGLNAGGKTVKGIETADSVAALKGVLKRKGVYLTAVTEAAAGSASSSRATGGGREIDLGQLFDRIRPKDVSGMTRLLSTLLCAGVTLPEALVALTEQVESPNFKNILSDIGSKVNEGSSLADAMASHGHVFTKLYINMIRAGEASGSLETVLIRIADFMDQQEELRSKLTTAMFYPMAMAVVGIGVVALLMVKVVPSISEIFAGQGAELPFTTRTLIATSDFVTKFWWLVILAAIGVVYLARKYRNSPAGRETTDHLLLSLPVIGGLARKIAIARFARTLATMLSSGVQLLQALDIVRSLLGNVILEKVLTQARDEIREGAGIAPALKRSGHFPALVTHMIAVGERSGQLEQMLTDLADAYDRETSSAITRATALLEPLMIVLMGGSVGFIVFAIMTPILQMNQLGAQ